MDWQEDCQTNAGNKLGRFLPENFLSLCKKRLFKLDNLKMTFSSFYIKNGELVLRHFVNLAFPPFATLHFLRNFQMGPRS
jgi:hypothetical protein